MGKAFFPTLKFFTSSKGRRREKSAACVGCDAIQGGCRSVCKSPIRLQNNGKRKEERRKQKIEKKINKIKEERKWMGMTTKGGGETLLQSNSTVRSIPLPRHLKDKDLLIQMRFPPPPRSYDCILHRKTTEEEESRNNSWTGASSPVFLLQPLCPCLSQLYAAPLWP